MLHLLLDFDGTLSDSSEGVIDCVRYALKQCGVLCNETTETLSHIFVGPPLSESFPEYIGRKDEPLTERFVDYFHERYIACGVNMTSMYPGCEEFLAKCSGKFGISTASSKPIEFVEKLLREYGIYKYFDSVFATSLADEMRTKRETIEKAMHSIKQVDNDAEFIMIGDRKYDVNGASEAGIECIGVRWGFALPGELEAAGAIAVADDFDALYSLVCEYAARKAIR